MIQLRCASPFQTGTSRTAFRVRDDIGAVHLHQVRLQPKSSLAGAGAADYQHIFIPCRFRVLRPAVHGKPFCLCQNDVIGEHRVHVWLNIRSRTPTRRAVLHVMAVFLCIFALQINRQAHPRAKQNPDQDIRRIKAGKWGSKRRVKRCTDMEHLS